MDWNNWDEVMACALEEGGMLMPDPPETAPARGRLVTSPSLFKDVQKEKPKSGGTRFTVVASTGAKDRDGETIDPAGWQIPTPLPKVLYGHQYSMFNVGAIERAVKSRGDGSNGVPALVLGIELDDDIPQDTGSIIVAAKVRKGSLNQGSVGFQPLVWKDPNGDLRSWEKGDRAWGSLPDRHYIKQELYEFSMLPVPSQMGSQVTAVRGAEDVLLALRGLGIEGSTKDVIERVAKLVAEADPSGGSAAPGSGATPPATSCHNDHCLLNDHELLFRGMAFVLADDEPDEEEYEHLKVHYERAGVRCPDRRKHSAWDLSWIQSRGVPFLTAQPTPANSDFWSRFVPASRAGK